MQAYQLGITMTLPNTLQFKGRPIHSQDNYKGFEVIITYSQPDSSGDKTYFYHVREDLKVLSDNTKGHGEPNIVEAMIKATSFIENFLSGY
ncbi:hypothetical protein [Anabaena sp. 4-3]|uniref:hypothetical protein n=1 Tax=Anabaena sp. 4-3 TaxID=1811979 RepID=UPI00082DD7CA|nr:hypothetical protein [Anabaena sp. 4-3]